MGSLSRMNATNRLKEAVEQQIEDAESEDDLEATLRKLTRIAGKNAHSSVSIDGMAEEIATDPDEIDFPE